MKNGKIFSQQVFRIILILFSVVFILLFSFLIVLYQFQIIGPRVFYDCVFLNILACACCIYNFHHRVLLPYRKKVNLFREFQHGLIFEELFQEGYQITPESFQVLKCLRNMINEQNRVNISSKQSEYLALQNQINPHFLYNTLDAIRGDALCSGNENIANITEALSKFFRYTITETKNLVNVENELENAENYFAIQEYRFGEKIKMSFNLPEEKQEILQLKIPKLTFQPIIENAIFHGLEKKKDGGTVVLNFETSETKLYISIKDDGVGIPEDELEELNRKLERVSGNYVNESGVETGGIALKNVCRRIKLLFGEEYGIHVYSLRDFGTDVRITIPKIRPEGFAP